MNKKMIYPLVFVLVGIYFFFFYTSTSVHKATGFIFGTYYSFTYEYKDNAKVCKQLEIEIQKELSAVSSSLSTFDKQSVISKINTNQDPELDQHFLNVYREANRVSQITHGAFDLTVAPLVNLWGFGFHPDSVDVSRAMVDSILTYCGYQKIHLANNHLVKENPLTMLDASAIAKGYGVDVVAHVFHKYGVKNYLIDIGGEIICKGNNPAGEAWSIGIDKPIDDQSASYRELQDTLKVHDASMATSGDYRQFYIKNSVKYSHEIDPHTGCPARNTTLSTTVIATSCMRADAFATAFMVLSLDSSIAIANRIDSLEVYIIYSGADGKFLTRQSNGFAKYLSSTKH